MDDIVTERHAHTGHLQRVCEPVVHEDAARQGEYLCLVLQSAERSREDKPVVIALKLRAIVVAIGMPVLLTETFVGNKLLPIHRRKVTKKFRVERWELRVFFFYI